MAAAVYPNVRIQETEDHGKSLVATECLSPQPPFGLLVFEDEALLSMPTRDSAEDKSGPPPDILEPCPQAWTDWWTYRQQPEEVRQRVLNMYTEMDCVHAAAIRNYLREKDVCRQEEKCDVDFDKGILDNMEEFIRFCMVIRFNSVELCPPSPDGSGPGTDFGHGIFETACRINHSCKPNCIWLTSQDGKTKSIRAIMTIEKGEELTLDYVGNTLDPTPQRREELRTTKGFTCGCDRCSATHDDTRRFRCVTHAATHCQGVHFLAQPFLTSEPELLDCSYCGTAATVAYKTEMLQQESQIVKEIQEVSQQDNDVNDRRIVNLEPPHQLHCLAEKCYELQGELYSGRGEYRCAAEAYAKQLRCRATILGGDYPSQTTAFCCERLGDALRHVNVQAAEEAYKSTVRSINLARGGQADPYCICAMEKLLEVQNCRANCQPDELPHQEEVEGILSVVPGFDYTSKNTCVVCGNPSTIEEEYQGDTARYCCEQHRKLHIPAIHQNA